MTTFTGEFALIRTGFMIITTILGNIVLGVVGLLFILFAVSSIKASVEINVDDGIFETHENNGLLGCLAFVGGVVMVSIAVGGGLVWPAMF